MSECAVDRLSLADNERSWFMRRWTSDGREEEAALIVTLFLATKTEAKLIPHSEQTGHNIRRHSRALRRKLASSKLATDWRPKQPRPTGRHQALWLLLLLILIPASQPTSQTNQSIRPPLNWENSPTNLAKLSRSVPLPVPVATQPEGFSGCGCGCGCCGCCFGCCHFEALFGPSAVWRIANWLRRGTFLRAFFLKGWPMSLEGVLSWALFGSQRAVK